MAGRRKGFDTKFQYYSPSVQVPVAATSSSSNRIPHGTRQITPPLDNTARARYQALLAQHRSKPAPFTPGTTDSPLPRPSSTTLQTTSNAPSNNSIVDHLVAAIIPVLTSHQQSTLLRIQQLGTTVETTFSQLKDIRKETQDQIKEVSTSIEKTQSVQLSTTRILAARLEKLEKMIGTSYDRDDKKSLSTRLDSISFAVEELLERANDPDAPLIEDPGVLAVDARKTPIVIDLQTPEPSLPEPEPPVRLEIGTSSVPRIYFDAAIDSRTPEPMTSSLPEPGASSYHEDGTDPTHPVHMDVAVWTEASEPAPPLPAQPIHYEIGTDPIHLVYADVAVGTETPEPPPPLPPRSIRHEIGTSPIRCTYLHTGTGPRTPLPEAPPTNLVSTGVIPSPTPGIHRSESLRRFSSGVMLSPVDWSHTTGIPHDTNAAQDEEDSDQVDDEIAIFYPDASLKKTKQFSLLREKSASPDGSVASLRQSALGDSLAGPVISSPRRPIITAPLYSRPSVSIMPSPAYSLSPSYTPQTLSPRPHTPKSLSPSVSPVKGAPSNAVHINHVTSVQSTSLSPDQVITGQASPDTEDPVDEMQSTVPQSPNQPSTSDSVDEEMLVSQMIADAALEESLPEPSPPRHESPSLDHESSAEDVQLSIPVVHETKALGEKPPVPGRSTRLSMSRNLTPAIKNPLIEFARKSTTARKSLTISNSPFAPIAKLKTPPPPKASSKPPLTVSPIYVSSRSPSPISELTELESVDSDDVQIIPAKKKVKTEPNVPESSQPKKRSVLRINIPRKDSAAATRIKKRKAKPIDIDVEPPLKRARQKSGVKIEDAEFKGKDNREVKSEEKTNKGKSKASARTPSTSPTKTLRPKHKSDTPKCDWPVKLKASENGFHQKFIECEICYSWYHYGCVGIKPGDPIAEGRDIFTCPPCSSGGANPLISNYNDVICARPDCRQDTTKPNEYFVSHVIGRTTKVQSGRGRRYLWLVKWDGYPISQATWEEEESMTDPGDLIERFNEAVRKEGLPDDPHATILLKEAVKGGWKDPNA